MLGKKINEIEQYSLRTNIDKYISRGQDEAVSLLLFELDTYNLKQIIRQEMTNAISIRRNR